jgi:hypothetical protein
MLVSYWLFILNYFLKGNFGSLSLDIEFWVIFHFFGKILYLFFRSLKYIFGYGFMKQ